jgi:hypothetical protein
MVTFLKKYFASVYIPLLWTLIVGILCCLPGAMLPNETHFAIPNFDKLVHATFFGGFVFLWNLYEAKRIPDLQRLLKLFFLFYLLGCIYGIGTELAQRFWIPGRDYDEADIIADLMGAGIAYGLSHLLFIRTDKPPHQ